MIYLYDAIVVIALILIRVLIVLGVKNECERRETNCKKEWIVLTAVIGLLSALTFACFVPKKQKSNKKKFLILGGIIATVVAVILFVTLVLVPAQNEYDERPSFNYNTATFENEDGIEVTYDKMGKEYTAEDFCSNDGMHFYTKDGDVYRNYYDPNAEPLEEYGIENIETGEKLDGSNNDYYIGEDGYLYFFGESSQGKEWNIYLPDGYNDAVYYSRDGKLLYGLEDCCWDKDGNLVFVTNFELKDFKYEDIPKGEIHFWEDE